MSQPFTQRCNFPKLLAWVCTCVLWYGCLFVGGWADLQGDRCRGLVLLAAAIVISVPVLPGIYSILAFPLPYSAFGRRRRTQLPSNGCVFILSCAWGGIGKLHSFATWRVYRTGIAVHLFPVGQAFLPREAITSISHDWWGQYALHHSCEELRSPVVCPPAIWKMITTTWRPDPACPFG
jgi:hypothetical protein